MSKLLYHVSISSFVSFSSYDNDVLMLVWMVSMGLKVITLYVLSIILLVSGEEDAAEGGVSLVLQGRYSVMP